MACDVLSLMCDIYNECSWYVFEFERGRDGVMFMCARVHDVLFAVTTSNVALRNAVTVRNAALGL